MLLAIILNLTEVEGNEGIFDFKQFRHSLFGLFLLVYLVGMIVESDYTAQEND